jgi:hypothetical protein
MQRHRMGTDTKLVLAKGVILVGRRVILDR